MIVEFLITDPLDFQKSVYLKVRGRNGEYQIRIEIENNEPIFEPSSCDCPFGSVWSQTKENRKKGKVCSHLREALKLLEYMGYINLEETEND